MEKRLDRIEDSIHPSLTADVNPTPNLKEDDMPCQQPPETKSPEVVVKKKRSSFKGIDVSNVILNLDSEEEDTDGGTSKLNLNLTPSSQPKSNINPTNVGRTLRFSSSPPVQPNIMPIFTNPLPRTSLTASQPSPNNTHKFQSFGCSPAHSTPRIPFLGNKSQSPITPKVPKFSMSPRSKAPQVQKRMDATMENPLKKKQCLVPSFTPKSKSTLKGKDMATQSTPKVNPLNPCGQTYPKVRCLLHVVTIIIIDPNYY